MKIYFAGSIRGGREYVDIYKQVIHHLKSYGEVLTEHVASDDISHFGEHDLTPREVFDRDMKWLSQADVLVADVSLPSLGVGFEIAQAIEKGLSILCLVHCDVRNRLSAMISGCPDLKIGIYQSVDDAFGEIDEFLISFES